MCLKQLHGPVPGCDDILVVKQIACNVVGATKMISTSRYGVGTIESMAYESKISYRTLLEPSQFDSGCRRSGGS